MGVCQHRRAPIRALSVSHNMPPFCQVPSKSFVVWVHCHGLLGSYLDILTCHKTWTRDTEDVFHAVTVG